MNFIDLQAQRQRIAPQIDAAVARVLTTCGFIMGPEVTGFEQALAEFAGAKHALSCANGTDALLLPLRAWNIGPGDAVFCPSFTFVATAEVVPLVGASPVFVDVLPDTYNIDPASLEAAIIGVKKDGKLKPRAIIAVDLFGQPADYPAISKIAKAHGLKLIADQAQGFGCTLNGSQPMEWVDAATASFFPAKPLGCYGDGGAVLTNDRQLADLVDSIRVHGKASAEDMAAKKYDNDPRYLNMRIGMNSRLDAIQAAILSEKLKIYPDELKKRDAIAARYSKALASHVRVGPESDRRRLLELGAVHHRARQARCAGRPPQDQGRADGDLLSDPDPHAGCLFGLPKSARRPARHGSHPQPRSFPAHASLSGCSAAGPGDRRDPRVQRLGPQLKPAAKRDTK